MAVKLRPEETRHSLQDLVGPLGFSDFLFEVLDLRESVVVTPGARPSRISAWRTRERADSTPAHAGMDLLRELADQTGLSAQVTAALADTYHRHGHRNPISVPHGCTPFPDEPVNALPILGALLACSPSPPDNIVVLAISITKRFPRPLEDVDR